ncbi:MAG TPA: hypothetical protein DCS82_01080 [Rhodospirillaceae bacterium]|nr:hypothetical protein [Rhodospirillaceae bacterium]HAA93923.1 hypothetical protein [Rhodospirillaceae bacterium]HAT34282.1 hypothetical protein [Rhodospirillaceae bacterium]|tara:strand:- start:77 stop:523 length:447 start_codon:yes stop_codon:yes gene_type:complete
MLKHFLFPNWILVAFLVVAVLSPVRAAEDKKGAPEAPVDKPEFIEMDSLTVPVIRGGKVEKYVLIKVTLEMVDSSAKSLAVRSFPRLKDAFYRALYDYFGFQRPGTKGINVRIVKARLLRAGARAIGKNKIKAVLIQRAAERGSGKGK